MPLAPDDAAFAKQHAAAYAASSNDPDGYAEWYFDRYAKAADDLGDLPSHTIGWREWQEYLDRRGPAPAGDAPQDEWDAWQAHALAVL